MTKMASLLKKLLLVAESVISKAICNDWNPAKGQVLTAWLINHDISHTIATLSLSVHQRGLLCNGFAKNLNLRGYAACR